jgi:hypothetical protein
VNNTYKLNNQLSLPVAITSLAAGIVSICIDTPWYVYMPLILITAASGLASFRKKPILYEFEVISQEITIDIKDVLGEKATMETRSKLKALKNGAFHYNFVLYSDGIINQITTETGNVSSISIEGGRLSVNTNIESPVSKGKEIEHTLRATYLGSFVNQKEYWQTMRNTPGTNVKITILTPNQRIIKDFKAFKVIGQSKTLTQEQPYRIAHSNRSGITFNFVQVKLLDQFRVEWTW